MTTALSNWRHIGKRETKRAQLAERERDAALAECARLSKAVKSLEIENEVLCKELAERDIAEIEEKE